MAFGVYQKWLRRGRTNPDVTEYIQQHFAKHASPIVVQMFIPPYSRDDTGLIAYMHAPHVFHFQFIMIQHELQNSAFNPSANVHFLENQEAIRWVKWESAVSPIVDDAFVYSLVKLLTKRFAAMRGKGYKKRPFMLNFQPVLQNKILFFSFFTSY
ncbi:hypothetical protein ACFX2I_043526 [Malus domestica]